MDAHRFLHAPTRELRSLTLKHLDLAKWTAAYGHSRSTFVPTPGTTIWRNRTQGRGLPVQQAVHVKHGLGDALALLIGVYVWIRVMGWLAPIVGPLGAVALWLWTAVVGMFVLSKWYDRRAARATQVVREGRNGSRPN